MLKEKIILSAAVCFLLVSPLALAAAPAVSVTTTGLSKIVLSGTATAKTNATLSLQVVSTSKNVKNLKGTNQTISVGDKTKITKDGKRTTLAMISSGTRLKVFGILDKKTGLVSQVRWIKILSK